MSSCAVTSGAACAFPCRTFSTVVPNAFFTSLFTTIGLPLRYQLFLSARYSFSFMRKKASNLSFCKGLYAALICAMYARFARALVCADCSALKSLANKSLRDAAVISLFFHASFNAPRASPNFSRLILSSIAVT